MQPLRHPVAWPGAAFVLVVIGLIWNGLAGGDELLPLSVSALHQSRIEPPGGATVEVVESRATPLPETTRWFNGRPIRPAAVWSMRVTAYSPDERSCGRFADGITASGYSVWTNAMQLVAADTEFLPFGSLVSVPGYHDGAVVPVLDRGGKIKGRRLDVLYPTHERALQWGVRDVAVTIWEYAGESDEAAERRSDEGL